MVFYGTAILEKLCVGKEFHKANMGTTCGPVNSLHRHKHSIISNSYLNDAHQHEVPARQVICSVIIWFGRSEILFDTDVTTYLN